MKFYLAAPYGRREEIKEHAEQLIVSGHTVTSRWLYGDGEEGDENPSPEQARKWAVEDFVDIMKCEALVLFNSGQHGRGGCQVEFGIALALTKPVVLVGKPSTVFHHYVGPKNIFSCFEDFLEHVPYEKKQTVTPEAN